MTTSSNLSADLSAFPIGQDGYPVAGVVISYYRKRMCYTTQEGQRKRWTQDDLARQLKISKAMVRKMEKNNQGLDSLERRRLLVDLLNIPPILLGLGTLEQLHAAMNAPSSSPTVKAPSIASSTPHIGREEVQLYQEMLPLFQGAYEQKALQASALETWIYRIASNLEYVDAQEKHKVMHLLVAYHVLASRVYSHDKNYMTNAYKHLNTATQFATMLNNPELLAYVHNHKGEVLLLEKQLLLAKNQMDYTVNLAKNINPQVRGRILTFTALAYSMINPDNSQKLYIRRLLEEAEICATNKGDTTLATFDLGIYYMDKADTLITLGLYKQVDRVLDDAEGYLQHIKRETTYIDILRAEGYIKRKNPEYETAMAFLDRTLQGNTTQNYHTNYVARLHKLITESSYGKAPDVVEMGQILRNLS